MKQQSESQIQQTVIQNLSGLATKHNFVFMCPLNEGVMMVLTMFKVPKLTCIKIMNWLKKMGFRKGASDLQIFHGGNAYFIELKTVKGELSEDQKIFRNKVLKAGCDYAVCRSWNDVLNCLEVWGVV